MTPVNVSEITSAVVAQLRRRRELEETRVSRAEIINESPTMCPWIGVYRQSVQYPIRVLGTPGGFRGQQVELVLVVQEQDSSSGAACEERLEQLIMNTISALFDDVTFAGTCETIDRLYVQYTSYQQKDAAYMQTAMIYFTALTRVI